MLENSKTCLKMLKYTMLALENIREYTRTHHKILDYTVVYDLPLAQAGIHFFACPKKSLSFKQHATANDEVETISKKSMIFQEAKRALKPKTPKNPYKPLQTPINPKP